jgi:serine/threonine-protein kinase
MTGIGVLLGTAAYMSPEQAKGKPADKRSDIWAFGCVLFEMLTGRRAFAGDDIAETLASVMKSEPDWHLLPPSTRPGLMTLLHGCVRKDHKARIGDISTALFLLANADLTPAAALPGRQRTFGGRVGPAIVAALVVGLATVSVEQWRRRPIPPPAVTRLAMRLPDAQRLTATRRAVSISPDGTHVAYAADGRLFLRALSEFEAKPIAGADPGINPTFSPDGRTLAFFAGSAIKRVAVEGGSATTIWTIAGAPTSLVWTEDDRILFTDTSGSIKQVPAGGGSAKVLVDMPSASAELAFSPQLLPSGKTVLFAVMKRADARVGRWDASRIVAQSLDTGTRTVIVERGSEPQYVRTGHILYLAEDTIFAAPFDLARLAVTGAAAPVVEGLSRAQSANTSAGRVAHFSVSRSGSLVYVPSGSSRAQDDLMLFDRQGRVRALKLPAGRYEYPRVSPDGKRVAFGTTDGREAAIALYDLSGKEYPRRLTFGGNNRFPVWSHDSKTVAFQSDRDGDEAIFVQSIAGGRAERLTRPEADTVHTPDSWSPNGRVLLFTATKGLVSALWSVSLPDRRVTPFSDVSGSALPIDAAFSNDGRFVAYQMGNPDETEGTTYVESFPPNGTKIQVLKGGRPVWSADGRELLLVPEPGHLLAVPVFPGLTPTFGDPVSIPRMFGSATPSTPRTFDVLRDGSIIAVGAAGQTQSSLELTEVRVVVNWFEELKSRVPLP